MADFNQPELMSLYADMVNVLKDRDISALKWLDGTTDDNVPDGAKRWNNTNNYFEKFNGTTWSALAAKYMIDVDKVDGCTVNDLGTSLTDLWTANKINNALGTKLDAASYTASDILTKIKTVDGSSSGLDADLLDGLHASSTNIASTVVARDASGNFSAGTITADLTGTASTATTLTGLTATVAELNFTDGVTSNIQTQLNSKLTSTGLTTTISELNYVSGVTSNIQTQLNSKLTAADGVPTGTIITYASSTAPTGYLKANGALISRNTYADLFAVIGTTFGAGDGSTTFALPDLRGYFQRGWDDGRGIDTSRVFGSNQDDAYENHTHTASSSTTGAHSHGVIGGNSNAGTTRGNTSANTNYTIPTTSAGAHSHAITVDASTSGSTETRPKNIALLYCIKY